MATVRIFEVIYDKFDVEGICVYVTFSQEEEE